MYTSGCLSAESLSKCGETGANCGWMVGDEIAGKKELKEESIVRRGEDATVDAVGVDAPDVNALEEALL